MAAFLDTDGISNRLHQLIKNSQETLIVVSPYLRISERIKRLLEEKEGLEKVEIWIVYGKDELREDEGHWLKSRTRIRSKFIQNMHSKCYLNEKEAIITSMNLHQYSQINNYEMGVYVTKDGDPSLYDAIRDEALGYLRMRDESKASIPQVHTEPDEAAGSKATAQCFCIHCRGKMMRPNHEYPYCPTCGKEWESNGSNPWREEKFCHICGLQRGHVTTKHPICGKECWSKYKKYRGWLESGPVPAGSAAG